MNAHQNVAGARSPHRDRLRRLCVALVLSSAGLAASATVAPAAARQPQPAPPQAPQEEMYRIDLRDEVAITQIIDLVRLEYGIQVVYTDDLSNTKIYLPAPVSLPRRRLLDFLTLLLEQKGYTVVKNEFGMYMIVPVDQVRSVIGEDPYASTQVVVTKGLKPSSLQAYMALIGGLANAVYADELGVIIATDSPGKIRQLRELIDGLAVVRDELQFIPFEVKNIAATVARDRILALIGEMTGTQGQLVGQPSPGIPQQGKPAGQQVGAAAVSQGVSNLTFQLLVDAQSNSLLFRGRPEEQEYVEALLALVDVPNKMKSVFYEVGVRAAEVIAFQGSREGLGDVTTYQSTTQEETGLGGVPTPRPGVQIPQQQIPGQLQGQPQTGQNTAGFVIYPEAGGFMYHGTPEQHARIEKLSLDLKQLSQGDLITMEFHKLKHAKAEDVVGIIGSLLGDTGGAANTGSILGQDLGRRGGSQRTQRDRSRAGAGIGQDNQAGAARDSQGGGLGAVGNDETVVIEDYKNNQVIVKTRQRLQPEFTKLIQRLDSRRPQVYVNAQIIAVTENMNNRFAVETQIIAGQFGLNTDFGLSSFGEMGDFLSRKDVATGLSGFTAAIVKSDYVPFIITAIQNNTDSKILATPQLLVDDNEPASVISENIVPTQVTRTPTSGDTITSVGDPARAGTTLEVTPQISENAVKLDIYIEQSAFTGEATENLPPPSQSNTLSSLVTVPRDCTIVIGGLTLESDTKTVVKVPFLGDIPLAGLLFRDTSKRRQRATLYVFLTPTIMTDPNFADLRLLTKGPAAAVSLESDHLLPPPELKRMEIVSPLVPLPPPAEPGDESPASPPIDGVPPPAPARPIPIGGPPPSSEEDK